MDDEDLIDKELKKMRKSGEKKKAKPFGKDENASPVVEEGDDESSVDSLMAESPTKYAKEI